MPVVQCPRPGCARKMTVAETALANAVRCPYCGQAFRLSRPATPPAAAPVHAPKATLSLPPEMAAKPPAPTLTTPPLATPVAPQKSVAIPAATLTDQAIVPTAVTVSPLPVARPASDSPTATLSVPPVAVPTATLTDQVATTPTGPPLAIALAPPQSQTPKSPAATLDLEAPAPPTGAAPQAIPAAPPTAIPLTSDSLLPSRIGRFEIRQHLGEGAFGIVYRAYDRQLDREVALKVAKPHTLNTEARVKRFLREAKAAASLRHPNIVPVFDSGRDGDHYYIASAFIPGKSLAGALEEQTEGKGLEVRKAVEIMRRLAEALAYAHSKGVIHRDVKLANAMLDDQGEPMLLDFGLAARAEGDEKLTQEATMMGTPAYMAPEQAAGLAEAASDQYSLGCALYELLTGQTPFAGPPEMQIFLHQSQEPPSPRKLNPKLPRDVETICLKCLAKKPVERYTSTQALAEDLGRFLAGEAIRARPEGALRWLGRKLRRHWLPTAAAVLLLAGLTVAGVIVMQQRHVQGLADSRSRQAAELGETIETALKVEAAAWTPAHAASIENQIAALDPLAPEQGARFRQRLTEHLQQSLTEILGRPRLDANAVERFEENLKVLADRLPQAVPELRQRLQQRLRTWETVFALQPPFANRATVLPATPTRLEGNDLIRDTPATPPPKPLVLTASPSEGNTQSEAVFTRWWTTAESVGLLLNASGERRYAFVLEQAKETDGKGSAAASSQQRRQLTIMRGTTRLATREVWIPTGPLTLRASRVGDLLTVQVNEFAPLAFQDTFPLATNEGRFGLLWPAGVGLNRLLAQRQALPPTLSPLEQADDLFARRQFAGALAAYQEQTVASGKGPLAQEARFKGGLCLLELNQPTEARQRFEEVAKETGERWPLVATCHLWLFHLKQRNLEEAEAVFLSISGRHRFEELLTILPDEIRGEILGYYRVTERDFFFRAPDLVTRAERAERVTEFLQETLNRAVVKQELIRAYLVMNQPDRALQTAREVMEQYRRGPVNEQMFASRVLTDYSWALRLRGEGRRARAELDSWIYQSPGVYRVYDAHQLGFLHLLLERVRVDAALEDWDQAERDVAESLKFVKAERGTDYYSHSAVYLFQGFLLERKGDRAGARAAWRQGTREVWRQQRPDREAHEGPAISRLGLDDLQNLFTAGLSGELSDADVEQFLSRTMTTLSGTSQAMPAVFVGQVRLSPDAMRKMLDAPRGRRLASQLAFRSIPYAQALTAPAFLLGSEIIRQGAFEGNPSAEQDAVIMILVEQSHAQFCTGKIGKTQLLQMALTWKGTTNFLGWEALAPALDAKLRGPAAYVLGQRLLRLNKPQEGEKLFRTARADAPADSPLKRLAEEALKRDGKN